MDADLKFLIKFCCLREDEDADADEEEDLNFFTFGQYLDHLLSTFGLLLDHLLTTFESLLGHF
eukprot:7796754-Heterocapsa_arctica.AAC.1